MFPKTVKNRNDSTKKKTIFKKNKPTMNFKSNKLKNNLKSKTKTNCNYESGTESETTEKQFIDKKQKFSKKKIRKTNNSEESTYENELLKESNIDSKDEETTDNDSSDDGNIGWADSIAKVLNTNKPTKKKNLVLSRAKKLNNPKNLIDKNYDFEVDGETENISNPSKTKERKRPKKTSKDLCVKPSPDDYEFEKSLKKIATQAVVQFFNAVQIQQKEIEDELEKAGPLDTRREAVYNNLDKRKFLQLLKRDKITKSKNETSTNNDSKDELKTSGSTAKGWSVLRPDFMTNKKLKDWDKEDSDTCNQSMESDSDDKE